MLIKADDQASGKLDSIGQKVDSVGQKSTLGSKALVGIGVAAAAGLGAAVNEAMSFEQGMANVNSIIQVSDKQLQAYVPRLESIGQATATGPAELARTLYDVVGAGYEADDALMIVDTAARSAAAGQTSADVAGRALVSTLGAYGLEAKDVNRVSDIWFQTVKQGIGTYEQLATNVADVLPLANALGVEQQELGAAYASSTLQGASFAQAETQIEGIMKALINPTAALTAGVQEYTQGQFETVEAWMASIPEGERLGAVLSMLEEQTGGSTEKLQEMLSTSEAVNGALNLMNKNEKGFVAQLKTMNAELAKGNVTQKAFATQTGTTMFALSRLGVAARWAAVGLGTGFLQPIEGAATGLANLAVGFTKLDPAIQSAVGMAAAATAGFLLLAGGLGLLPTILAPVAAGLGILLSPLALVAAAAVGLAFIFRAPLMDAARALIPVLGNLGSYLLGVAQNGDFLHNGLEKLPPSFQSFALAVGKGVDAAKDFIQTVGEDGWIAAFRELAPRIGQIGDSLGALTTQITGSQRAGELVTTMFNRLGDAVAAGADIADRFTTSYDFLRMVGLSPTQAAVEALARTFPSLGDEIRAAGGQVTAFIDGLSTLGAQITTGDFAGAFETLVSGFQEIGSLTIRVGDWIIEQTVDLATALAAKVTEWWMGATGTPLTLGSIAVTIGGWIVDAVTALWDTVTDWVMSQIGGGGGVSDGLGGTVGGGGGGIDVGSIALSIGGWIVDAVTDLWGAVTEWVMGQVGGSSGGGVSNGLGGTIGGGGAGIDVGAIALSISDWVVSAVSDLWGKVTEWVMSQVGGGSGGVSDGLGGTIGGGGGGIDVGAIALTISDWIVDAASDLWGKVSEFVEGLIGGGGGGSVGDSIVGGGFGGGGGGYQIPPILTTISDWIVEAASDLWGRVSEFVESQIGGGGGGSVGDSIVGGGFGGGGGYQIPPILTTISDWIVEAASDLWSKVSEFVESQIGGGGGGVSDGLGNTIGGGGYQIPPILTTISDWIVEAASDLWGKVSEFVESQIGSGGGVAINSGAAAIASGGYHIPPILVTISDWTIEEAVPLWDRVNEFLNGLIPTTIDASMLPGIQEAGENIGNKVTELLIAGVRDAFGSGGGTTGDSIVGGGFGGGGAQADFFDAAVAFLKGAVDGIGQAIEQEFGESALTAALQGKWDTAKDLLVQSVEDAFLDLPPVQIAQSLMSWWDGVIAQVEAFGASASGRFEDAIIPLVRGIAETWNSTMAKLPGMEGTAIDTSGWATSTERYMDEAIDAFQRQILASKPPMVAAATDAGNEVGIEGAGAVWPAVDDGMTSTVSSGIATVQGAAQQAADQVLGDAFTTIDVANMAAAAGQAGTQVGTEVTVSFGDEAAAAIPAAAAATAPTLGAAYADMIDTIAKEPLTSIDIADLVNEVNTIGIDLGTNVGTGAVEGAATGIPNGAAAALPAVEAAGLGIGGDIARSTYTGVGTGFEGVPIIPIPGVPAKLNDMTITSLAAADPTAAASTAGMTIGQQIDAGLSISMAALQFTEMGASLGVSFSTALQNALTTAISGTQINSGAGAINTGGIGTEIATMLAESVTSADFSVVSTALQTAIQTALAGASAGGAGAGAGGAATGLGSTIGLSITTDLVMGISTAVAAADFSPVSVAIQTALQAALGGGGEQTGPGGAGLGGGGLGMTIGTQIATDIATGIAAGVGNVTAAANSLVTAIGTTLAAAAPVATTAGTAMGNAVGVGLAAAAGNVTGAANSLVTAMAAAFNAGAAIARTAGTTVGAGFASGLAAASGNVTAAANSLTTAAAQAMNAGLGIATSAGTSVGNGFAAGIAASVGNVSAAANSIVTAAVQAMNAGLGIATSAGTSVGNGFGSGIAASSGNVSAAANSLVTVMAQNMNNGLGVATSAGSSVGNGFASGIAAANGAVSGAAAGLTAVAASALMGGVGAASSAGSSFGSAFASGISSASGAVAAAAGALAAAASAAIQGALAIASPSKVGIHLGEFFGEGFAIGIEDSTSRIVAAMMRMIDLIDARFGDAGDVAVARLREMIARVESEVGELAQSFAGPTLAPAVIASSGTSGSSSASSSGGNGRSISVSVDIGDITVQTSGTGDAEAVAESVAERVRVVIADSLRREFEFSASGGRP